MAKEDDGDLERKLGEVVRGKPKPALRPTSSTTPNITSTPTSIPQSTPRSRISPAERQPVRSRNYGRRKFGITLAAILGISIVGVTAFSLRNAFSPEYDPPAYVSRYEDIKQQFGKGKFDEANVSLQALINEVEDFDSPEAQALLTEATKFRDQSVLPSIERRDKARLQATNEQKLDSIVSRFDEFKYWLGRKEFSKIDTTIKRFMDEISQYGFAEANAKLKEVRKWHQEKYVPARVNAWISDINTQSDYKRAKLSIDQLAAFCESSIFPNKREKIREVQGLHERGIGIEVRLIGQFFREYDALEKLAEQKRYKAGMERANQLSLSGLVYLDWIRGRSEGKRLKDAGIQDNSGFGQLVSRYKSRIKPGYDQVMRLFNEASRSFGYYTQIIEREDIDWLLEADAELQKTLPQMDVRFPECSDLKPEFTKYHTQIYQKLRTLARKKQSEYERRLTELGDKLVHGEDETKAEQQIQQLRSEMLKYKSTLFSDRYLK